MTLSKLRLGSRLSMPSLALINTVMSHSALRGFSLQAAKRRIYHIMVERNAYDRPHRVQQDKYQMACNMLDSIHKAVADGRISPSVRGALVKNLLGKILFCDNPARAEFIQTHGYAPPLFLLISPTKRCNLNCVGCYACSSASNAEQLDYRIFDRILREKRDLWGSHFTTISGGEPLLWKSEDRDLIDLAGEHSDQYFLMYTNGTLINERRARRLAEVGNITPAVSVEGFEAETDRRRGKGVYGKILRAFENLRGCGVPFGISITAMKDNAEFVLSDEFIDFYFEEQGAMYAWVFQYMPIGRGYTLELMVTPEQRKRMFEREQDLLYKKGLFVGDFWNSGTLADGCISAGRPNGYFYVDWNANCLPCGFYPYTVDNIRDVYERGGDLNTALMSPFFESIRKWQADYCYSREPHQVGNEICPCAIKDHYRNARETIEETGARPGDEQAEEALKDPDYYAGLVAYGQEVDRITRSIWESEYIEPERERSREQERDAGE